VFERVTAKAFLQRMKAIQLAARDLNQLGLSPQKQIEGIIEKCFLDLVA
jgi:hypothetical protein